MVPGASGKVRGKQAREIELACAVGDFQTIHPGDTFCKVILDVTVHHCRIGIFVVVAIVLAKM